MKKFKYEKIFKMNNRKLLTKFLPGTIKRIGDYNVQRKGSMYLYGRGNIPVMLVAHVDTVHTKSPETILYDREKDIAWSPAGIGGDDRAGVLGLLKIIEKGYKPHLLFTDGEESGGIGASEAAKALSHEVEKFGIKFIIELDREGSHDACFYNCYNTEFEDYIMDFGFKTAFGSFSDISIICPKWDIAGVNLSSGYYNSHTTKEFIKMKELFTNVKKVTNIFDNIPKNKEKFVYNTLGDKYSSKYSYGYGRTYTRGRYKNSSYNWNKSEEAETYNQWKKKNKSTSYNKGSDKVTDKVCNDKNNEVKLIDIEEREKILNNILEVPKSKKNKSIYINTIFEDELIRMKQDSTNEASTTNKSTGQSYEEYIDEYMEESHTSKEKQLSKSIIAEVDSRDLSFQIGGTQKQWDEFIEDNGIEIEEDIRELIIDHIFEKYPEVYNFVY